MLEILFLNLKLVEREDIVGKKLMNKDNYTKTHILMFCSSHFSIIDGFKAEYNTPEKLIEFYDTVFWDDKTCIEYNSPPECGSIKKVVVGFVITEENFLEMRSMMGVEYSEVWDFTDFIWVKNT